MSAAIPNPEWWVGRRVFVTGHTGFVGGWLCAWLMRMGARVTGYALAPPTQPSFCALTDLAKSLDRDVRADVRDASALRSAVEAADPQVVLHLAAQPIVREAWREPAETFAVNVMGTVNVLETCRGREALERIVVYTTDKVYRNDQSGRAFGEDDALGGNEPYSASKAAADWAARAYWESYFRGASPRPALAIVRAGNIIGGGDWSADRLLPDAVRAFGGGDALTVRSPAATRPWQHVADAVRGTLLIAERPASDDDIAWNLGPRRGESHSVAEVADEVAQAWGEGARWRPVGDGTIPESRALVLSSERAALRLGWECAWGLRRSVGASVEWYKAALGGKGDLLALTQRQIAEHLAEVARVPA